MELIRFTRRERLPVTGPLIEAYGMKVAAAHNITIFKALNGSLERFLRRSPVQPSFKLHAQGSAALPHSCEARKEEIRDKLSLNPVMLRKHKNRVSIVLCINGDGTHSVPLHYIGKSALPTAISDPRFIHFRSQYSSQANPWMDSKQFTE